MSTEEVRPIPGFPGYFATSLGRVFSERRGQRRELIGGSNPGGYRVIALRDAAGVRYVRTRHRVIAEVFLGPRPEGLHIRHLDGDKSNNAVSNLRYGTASENQLDAVAHGVHFYASRTHCPRGHAYDEVNTYLNTRGHRMCRTCMRLLADRRAA